MKKVVASTLLPLMLIACKGAGPPTPMPSELATEDSNGSEAATAPSEPAVASASASSPAEAAKDIPLSMQGRWGLGQADCTSTNGDEKGLMIVGADSLKFYESRGKIAQISERSDTRLHASFAFSGEGMNWKSDIAFDLKDGGKSLIKHESDTDAGPSSLKYERCKG